MIKIGTDGSALGNPGPAGWAWYLNDQCWAAGGWEKATNNQGELYAVLDLLRTTRNVEEEILICLDSQYTLNSITQWRFAWRKSGWRTAAGKPVKNLELMQALDAELGTGVRRAAVRFEWVRGHQGHPLNEAADQRARAVAEAYQQQKPVTGELSGPGWTWGDTPSTDNNTVKSSGSVPSSIKHHIAANPGFGAESPIRPHYPAVDRYPEPRGPIEITQGPLSTSPDSSAVREYQQGPYTIREHYVAVPLKQERPGLWLGDRHSTYQREVMEEYFSEVERWDQQTTQVNYDFNNEFPASTTGERRGDDAAAAARHPDTSWDQLFQQQKINLFAREIFYTDNPPQEYLIFFQGGPGCPANRLEDWGQLWFGEALKHFRLILLDQRGTGLSTPIDSALLPHLGSAAGYWLRQIRADQIVADAETLREYFGIEQWNVLGQSFGGFIITSYLSRYPDAIKRAFITGGLPPIASADVFYRFSYSGTAKRCEEFYREIPRAEDLVRRVASHLRENQEYLPNGELLTVNRFRSLGMILGRTYGLATLRNLFEDPFLNIAGTVQLSGDFLAQVGEHNSYARNPLYILIHETCAAQSVPGSQLGTTNWSANRVREQVAGFEAAADPKDYSRPYYLTAEHFGLWSLADPTLFPWAQIGQELATWNDWPALYDPQTLQAQDRPIWATVYPDDVYVPRALSRATGSLLGATVIEQPDWHHDGLRTSNGKVLTEMFKAAGLD